MVEAGTNEMLEVNTMAAAFAKIVDTENSRCASPCASFQRAKIRSVERLFDCVLTVRHLSWHFENFSTRIES